MQPTAVDQRGSTSTLLPSDPELDQAPPPAPEHRSSDEPPAVIAFSQQVTTSLIVAIPSIALVVAIVLLWDHGIGWRDLVIAVVLYMLVGHGIAIGFHRMLAHRSFRAARALRISLAVIGSMAFEGGPIGWVADHRCHHVYTDKEGDPHSPHTSGSGFMGQLKGLGHAHAGWLFSHTPTDPERYAADLMRDPDMVVIDRLFPLWCAVSLAIPFALGWVLGGSLAAGLITLLWAGLVRVCVLHHVTWSVNSVCHVIGRRPFQTKDQSTNVAALAIVSFGESWHNGHHAFPTSSRLGVDAHQIDTSAMLISAFERFGWAEGVHRVDPDRRARRRRH
jgi:stearoyl-CoA desaturase (Delta-9 desaturase)